VFAATAAYRTAFASDLGRQARLFNELQALLDPGRPDGERVAVVAAFAPHVPADDAHAVLASALQGLAGPPVP
jgi:hypothetical protein